MRFGVDDPVERIAATLADDAGDDGGHVPLGVVVGHELRPDPADEPGVPLGVEPGAALRGRGRQPRVVLEVLGDRDLPGLGRPDLVVDPGQERPAVGQRHRRRARRVAVRGPDVDGRIEPEAVAPELLEPGHRAVAQERPDLAAAVVGAGPAPQRHATVVVVEVDAAAVALGPAVEPPQVEVRRSEMVVDDVDDDRDAPGVRIAHERLERVRPAVGRLDGEQVGRVVAPRDVAGELERRHDLDGRHAEVLEVAQPSPRLVEGPGPVAGRGECPDVHLVDDEVVPAGHRDGVVTPVERRRVVDDAVADRIRDQPGVRVDPRQVALVGPDGEFVLRTGFDVRDVRRPCPARAVAVAFEGGPVAGPVVERAGHEDRRGVWCPDTERRPAPVGEGTHAGAFRRGSGRHVATIQKTRAGRRSGPRFRLGGVDAY